MDHPRLEQRLAAICELGCLRVREIIAAWEQDYLTVEGEGLNPGERAQVLAELKAIMGVYNTR
jgi:hypothetical protein